MGRFFCGWWRGKVVGCKFIEFATSGVTLLAMTFRITINFPQAQEDMTRLKGVTEESVNYVKLLWTISRLLFGHIDTLPPLTGTPSNLEGEFLF